MELVVDWCSFVQFCLYTYYGEVLHNYVGILFGLSMLVRLVQPCSMYAAILFGRSMVMFFVR